MVTRPRRNPDQIGAAAASEIIEILTRDKPRGHGYHFVDPPFSPGDGVPLEVFDPNHEPKGCQPTPEVLAEHPELSKVIEPRGHHFATERDRLLADIPERLRRFWWVPSDLIWHHPHRGECGGFHDGS